MEKINTSALISELAPILEKQNIFIRKITFKTFEDENDINIEIEGKIYE